MKTKPHKPPPSSNNALHDVSVYIHCETATAWRLSNDGVLAHSIWVPKSMCEIEIVPEKPIKALMRMPSFMAHDMGLI
jgi:hypothetical protein